MTGPTNSERRSRGERETLAREAEARVTEIEGGRHMLSLEEREAVRARVMARVPSWYNPLIHLLVPSLSGIGLVVGAILLMHDVQAWQVALVVPFFVILNAGEWRIHRDLLHRRTPGFTVLYDRHTPEHHMVYVTDDMAMRSRREWRMVLLPGFGIWASLLSALPVPAILALVGQWNVGMLFIATAMGYVVLYEWLHLSYHLSPDSFVGRLKLIQILRRHHATHHNPQLMRKWNFNVSIPLWDLVRGTIWRDGKSARARGAKAGSAEARSAN